MSKRERAKMIAIGPDVSNIHPDACWTIGKRPSGYIDIDGTSTPYWMPDSKPIAQEHDLEIPF